MVKVALLEVDAVTEALHSSNWYRVAAAKPRVRGHVRIHRHVYRGQLWYVFEDRVAGKYHRFNPATRRVIGLMDGSRDMASIWQLLTQEPAEDTPTQEEIINLLGQLYAADLIHFNVTADVAELFSRRKKFERQRFASRYLNPMSLRFPLVDPDRLLTWLASRPHLLKGGWASVIWFLIIAPALALVPMHWPDLTENFTEQLLSLDNLLLMAVMFPVLKALHELGHGLATKSRGGEVHEMGIMLLVLFPVPYVDASSASALEKKTDRMLVGAAGMLVELFIACVSLYAWLLLEPGLIRSLTYNLMVMASVSTVLFNGNPLLRFDGYYVLADLIEVPNLGARSTKYWQYLAERYLVSLPGIDPPPATPGERRWFLFYAPAAFAYRMSVLFGISILIAKQYFFVGVVLALWGLIASLGVPLYKMLRALFFSSRFQARSVRVRTLLVTFGVALYCLFFVLDFPQHSLANGVIWLPEEAIVRAQQAGFVTRMEVPAGAALKPGDLVLQSTDPELLVKLRVQNAKVAEASARYDAAWGVNAALAAQTAQTLRREQAGVDDLAERVSELMVRASVSGVLTVDRPDDLPGRYLEKGQILGYLLGQKIATVRVVVSPEDVELVRQTANGVEVMLPHDGGKVWPARVVREVPAAGHELPSPALGMRGGGDIVVNPSDESGIRTVQSWFEFELELVPEVPARFLGSRVLVRFEHYPTPLGYRVWRGARRLFLSQFHV